MTSSLRRACAALTITAAALSVVACNAPAQQPAGTASSAQPSAPATSAPASSSPAETPSAPAESASPSAEPSAAASRVSSADGVFSVEMPAGWNQNPTSDDKLSSITLNDPQNGNLQILSLRYSKPQTTITDEFSVQRNAIVKAFPKCTFPKGADVLRESLGGKADANYRVFTCDSMPFAYTVFTTNGPNGEFLAGHDADFDGKADRWKDIVRSVVTAKK